MHIVYRRRSEPPRSGATTPGEEERAVIFNRTAEQWGDFRYDEGEDVLRVTVAREAGEHVESMDFVIEGGAI